MQMISDRQMQKLKQSYLSIAKHQSHQDRFQTFESPQIHTRPKIELEPEQYSRWIKAQKSALQRVETEKIKRYKDKIDRAEKIKQMKQQENKNKEKLRQEMNQQIDAIKNEYSARLIKMQKRDYAKQIRISG